MLLFSVTEEQSSRRRERKIAFDIAGNGDIGRRKETLAADTIEIRDMRACSHVTSSFRKDRGDLEAEPELRKIGQIGRNLERETALFICVGYRSLPSILIFTISDAYRATRMTWRYSCGANTQCGARVNRWAILGLCSEHCIPDLRRSLVFDA
jgi:hypothetical protein